MNAKQREMLAMIDALLAMPDHVSEPPVVREIARRVVCGYSPAGQKSRTWTGRQLRLP
jgi:hypothetical protein